MNIAIIGGGIGGLATVIALLKKGFNVQVYERAQALRTIGAGLTLSPNGLNSLDAIQPGIVELLKRSGSQMNTLTLKRSTGEMIASKPITTLQNYGQPLLNIQWSRLQAILASVIPPDVIHLNHRCIGFEQHENSVEVYFEDGKTVQSDLLIGADGINSIVRQLLIGDDLSYAGRMSWRAVIHYPHELLTSNTSTLIIAPDGKNFLLVDVGGGYTFWSAGALLADDSVCQCATDAKARVAEIFAEWVDPVEAIIKATPADKIVERPIFCDRTPLKRWSEGKVTLLGDAAHPVVPSLGQGANTAFEDAYELAECLVAPSIEAALESYEHHRIPRTEAIYTRSANLGDNSYKPESETAFREMMKPSQMNQDEFQEWLYSYKPSVSR